MSIRYDRKFFEYLENLKRQLQAQPLILGGVAGSGGGAGGTPGGFIGYLPQTRVAYDYTEAGSDYTPPSGISLLDNLNHIRYYIDIFEGVIDSNSDITFPGGGGLPYGSFYTNSAIARTMTDQNTWYEVDAATAWTVGSLNICTFTDPYLIAPIAGTYKIEWNMSGSIGTASQIIRGGIMVDQTTAQNQGRARLDYRNANRILNMSGTALISLTANQKVSLAVSNTTSAGKIYTVQNGNLTMTMVGG